MLNKLSVLLIHIIVVILLAYLSYMIITHKQIPFLIGIFLVLLAFIVVVSHIYFFIHHKESSHKPSTRNLFSSSPNPENERGKLFDPNDPDYINIGGVGGLGWV